MINYAELLTHRNVQAFLALIKYTDGAGYQTLFGGSQNLRHLGMIATSGSYRRHWLAWRWWKYPSTKH